MIDVARLRESLLGSNPMCALVALPYPKYQGPPRRATQGHARHPLACCVLFTLDWSRGGREDRLAGLLLAANGCRLANDTADPTAISLCSCAMAL